ncbi:hypothetical protein [Stenotrophomonas rhizophila]|jgi:hypothetical protein|uniref:hypothetical protein n=1 Tax=Stenotrophomonas rhizophila TaxID=216778 RepID=UPI001AEC20EB|nr:hypothetical protein [Stenotrophomonas rhizophila]
MELIEPAIHEHTFRWLIKGSGVLVGVQLGSGWCVRVAGDVALLDSEREFVPVIPLLNVAFNDFSNFLERASLLNPECREIICNFPFELFLKCVFHTSYSGYWPELALDWLEEQDNCWSKYRVELAAICECKAMPQRARQRAQRMLRAARAS